MKTLLANRLPLASHLSNPWTRTSDLGSPYLETMVVENGNIVTITGLLVAEGAHDFIRGAGSKGFLIQSSQPHHRPSIKDSRSSDQPLVDPPSHFGDGAGH